MSQEIYTVHPSLIDLAALRLADSLQKQAFVPVGATDPAAAGGGGGAPPGAPPGGDPAAAGGGAPPAGGGGGDLAGAIQQAVQAAMQPLMQQMGGGAGGNPAVPGGGPAGVGAKMKIDPTLVYLKLGRVEKLFLNLYQQMGLAIPPDTLDDDAMIQAAAGQTPTPMQPSSGQGAAPPQGDQGLPGIGESPPIQPLEAPGASKTAEIDFAALLQQVDPLYYLSVIDAHAG